MLNKLLNYYPDTIIKKTAPNINETRNYHWFQENPLNDWIGIPVDKITNEELDLLKNLFICFESPQNNSSSSLDWYNYLFSHGSVPIVESKSSYHCIHFKLLGSEWDKYDIELAIKGFFHEDSTIIWYSKQQCILVEKNNSHISYENLYSLVQTFESDFLVKVYIYITGKVLVDESLPKKIQQDIKIFEKSIELIPSQRVIQFEQVFPYILTSKIKKELEIHPISNWMNIFYEEPDLLATIKVYLENNSNASLAAKKLYIHRNTLQYRVDKFSEKTGINLRDFNSVITVYLSCLFFEQQK